MRLKTKNGKWFIGSEHDLTKEEEYPDCDDIVYKEDLDGWPFFIGIKQPNHVDYHVAIGIQSKSDAYLIASAPDLLEACKGAIAALTQNKTFPADIEAAKQILNYAIAKAEGRE